MKLKSSTKLTVCLMVTTVLGFLFLVVLSQIRNNSNTIKIDLYGSNGNSITNIQRAKEAFDIKSFECPKSSFNHGDYILLVPDANTYTISTTLTGYNRDQTITPNELTLWRVINNDNCNI